MSKKKGSRIERELVNMFWDTKEWAVVRSAGSGLSSNPNPDLIASNGKRYVAVECKSIKEGNKYLTDDDVQQIIEFSKLFSAEAYIGMRFNNEGWYFLIPSDLKKTPKDMQ
jgi:Holliday junction resolvase